MPAVCVGIAVRQRACDSDAAVASPLARDAGSRPLIPGLPQRRLGRPAPIVVPLTAARPRAVSCGEAALQFGALSPAAGALSPAAASPVQGPCVAAAPCVSSPIAGVRVPGPRLACIFPTRLPSCSPPVSPKIVPGTGCSTRVSWRPGACVVDRPAPVVVLRGRDAAEHALRLEGCRSLVIVAAADRAAGLPPQDRLWTRHPAAPPVTLRVAARPQLASATAVRRVVAVPRAATRSPLRGCRQLSATRQDVEDGWRWREISAVVGSPKLAAKRLVPTQQVAGHEHDGHDSRWLWRDISCECCPDAPASVSDLGRSLQPAVRCRPPQAEEEAHEAPAERSPASEACRSAVALSDAATAAGSACGHEASDGSEAPSGAAPGDVLEAARDAAGGAPAEAERVAIGDVVVVGDVVVLGPGVPAEYRLRPAVVTKLADEHCTVVVLDAERRLGVGECWPSFADVAAVESSLLRLGTRVVLQNLQGARTRRLNGLSGVVAAHPKQGHPTFVSKPSAQGHPQLTVCVRFDDPKAAGERSALIEPRFLVPYDKAVEDISGDLGAMLAQRLDAIGRRAGGREHVEAVSVPERGAAAEALAVRRSAGSEDEARAPQGDVA